MWAGCWPRFRSAGGVVAWARTDLPRAGHETALRLPIIRQLQIVSGLLVLVSVLLSVTVAPGCIALLAGLVGAGLSVAGTTGLCGMAHLLAAMPWNRRAIP